MKILKISQENFFQAMEEAANILINHGIVVYPTDTAYGIGANGLKEHTIVKIYQVKQRREENPIHLIVRDIPSIGEIAEVSSDQEKILRHWLPGPLTFILARKPIVPDCLVNGARTIGVRIPNHRVTKELSQRVLFPYTATSANMSGKPTVYSIEELLQSFPQDCAIDLVLDYGTLTRGRISTMIDISEWPNYRIIRQGVISQEEFDTWASQNT